MVDVFLSQLSSKSYSHEAILSKGSLIPLIALGLGARHIHHGSLFYFYLVPLFYIFTRSSRKSNVLIEVETKTSLEMGLKERGISGIISILFLLIAFFIIFYSLYSLSQSSVSYIQSFLQREAMSQKASELSRSVSGFYIFYPDTGTISINVTSYFGEPVTIPRVIIIYSNGAAMLSNYLGITLQTGKSISFNVSSSEAPSSVIVALYTTSGVQATLPIEQSVQTAPKTSPSPFSPLSLKVNNTVLFDDFSTDPLASGRISALSGSWTWSPGILSVSPGGSSSPSRENIAYLNLSSYGFQAPLPSKIYVVTKVYQNDFSGSYADIVFLSSDSASSLYRAGAYYQNKNKMQAELYKYMNNRWSQLDSGNSIGATSPVILEAYLERGQSNANLSASVLSSGESSTAFYSDNNPLSISYVGIGSYNSKSTSFAFIYLSKSMDPLYVYIMGFPSSYTIRVLDSDGRIYNVNYDPTIGMFEVYLFQDPSSFSPVLRNALVLVYSGSSLVSSYYGDLWGGCVYSP